MTSFLAFTNLCRLSDLQIMCPSGRCTQLQGGQMKHNKDCQFMLSVLKRQVKIQHLWRLCLLPLVGTICSSNSSRSSCPQLDLLTVAALMTYPSPGPLPFLPEAQKILSIWNCVTALLTHTPHEPTLKTVLPAPSRTRKDC